MFTYKDFEILKEEEEFIILKKSDIENLGKKLMKEVYEHLNDDYVGYLEEIKIKIKKEKDELLKSLIKFYIQKDKKKIKYFNYKIEDEIEDKNLDKIKESYQGVIKNYIKNEVIDVDVIYKVLSKINLIYEMDEDLSGKKEAFLNIYKVFYNYYEELEY